MKYLVGFFLALALVYYGVITPEGVEQAGDALAEQVQKIPGKGSHQD